MSIVAPRLSGGYACFKVAPDRAYSSMATLIKTPGYHFVGITASGRELACTVDENGGFHADSHEVVRLVGWRTVK